MPATTETVQTFEFKREESINAPADVVFQAILDEMGPNNHGGDGKPMPLKIEQWPGGRWFRDLGNNTGHLWAHVQVIKPPTLIELSGPMFMSYPATNHVQYRLTAEGNKTLLKFSHRSMGLIPKDHMDGMSMGWDQWMTRIKQTAERASRR